jgi:hypothetical protein
VKTTPNSSGKLQDGNLKKVQSTLTKQDVTSDVVGMLLLVADMMDCIAHGQDMYMIIGCTQRRDAFSVTIKGSAAPAPFYGQDITDLGKGAVDCL